MTQWKQLRILFLALTLGSVLFVFVKVFLTKNTDNPKPEESRVKANIISLFEDYEPPAYSVLPHGSISPLQIRPQTRSLDGSCYNG